MKKTAIILSTIEFIITTIILLAASSFSIRASLAEYPNDVPTFGIALLVFSFIYIIFGLFLLIFTGKYVNDYNKIRLGILIIVFICIPGGILITCLPRYNYNYKSRSALCNSVYDDFEKERGISGNKRIDNSNHKFIKMVEKNQDLHSYSETAKAPKIKVAKCLCDVCKKEINKETKYLVEINLKKFTLCEKCLQEKKKTEKDIDIISSSMAK